MSSWHVLKVNRYKQRLDPLISPERYAHVCRVADTIKEFSETWDVSVESAQLAGFLHDAAKELNPAKLQAMGIPEADCLYALFDSYKPVWHAFVAPVFFS